MKSKKSIIGALLLALALPFSSAVAADSQPSSKVSAKTANLTLIPATTATTGPGGWVDVLTNNIKTSNQKDLFIGVSLEVGLYTRTLVKSKGGVSDTSSADAMVQVRVLVDGQQAEPGAVVFGRRIQTLSATLGGLTVDPTTGSIILDPTQYLPEEIDLILRTLDAASFNFVATNVPQGVHKVTIQARITSETSAQQGLAQAEALVGKGSMTVESVRLIKDANVVLEVD